MPRDPACIDLLPESSRSDPHLSLWALAVDACIFISVFELLETHWRHAIGGKRCRRPGLAAARLAPLHACQHTVCLLAWPTCRCTSVACMAPRPPAAHATASGAAGGSSSPVLVLPASSHTAHRTTSSPSPQHNPLPAHQTHSCPSAASQTCADKLLLTWTTFSAAPRSAPCGVWTT